MEVLFSMIVIQLLCNGFQTFMNMAWISVGFGPDIEGGGDSLIQEEINVLYKIKVIHRECL